MVTQQSGLALVVVLLVLVVVGLLAFATAFQAHLSAGVALQRQRAAAAEGYALAGLELAHITLETVVAAGRELPDRLVLPEAPGLLVELVAYRRLAPDSAVLVLRSQATPDRGPFQLEARLDIVAGGIEVVWKR